MNISEMNLQEVIERLAALDEEVRKMTDVEAVEKATEEKKELLERKAELEAVETRKAQALALTKGEAQPEKIVERKGTGTMEEKIYGIDSEEYRSAWVHALQGKKLTEAEERAFATTDAATAIPTVVSTKFFEKMKKLAPMLSEITLLQVAGNIKFMAEGTRSEATVHTENTAVAPAADTVVSVELGGKEFMKVIRISKAAETMSINAFEDWLVDMLAGDIARAIDNYILNDTTNGLVKMVSTATTNVITQTATSGYGYNDIVSLVALLPAAYDAEAKFLITKKVLFNDVKGILDKNNRPIFDPVEKTLFGYPVIIDDYVPSDKKQIFLGKFTDIVGNLSQPVNVARSDQSGFLNNSIDFRGTALFDSKLAKQDAIVWLKNS